MKKYLLIGVMVFLLSGCGAPKEFETLSDEYVQPSQTVMYKTKLDIPEEAMVSAITNNANGSIYLCDGYTAAVQTMASGDLRATIRSISGYEKERVSMFTCQDGDLTRHACVWTAVGEGEDHVYRSVILDDGNFHYTLTVSAPASTAGAFTQVWKELLDSFTLDIGA